MATPIIISVITIFLGTWVQLLKQLEHRVLLRRLLASLIFVAIPFIYLLVTDHGKFGGESHAAAGRFWIITLFLTWLTIPVSYVSSRSEKSRALYPHLRADLWTLGLLCYNFFTWALYTIAYEFLFRGFLFFTCLQQYGFWTAAVVNVTAYGAAHLHQGYREAALSIPFGILLCAISWYTGGFWSAAIIHGMLACSNDFFSIQANPRMRFYYSSSNQMKS